jgi:hypothetical protein
MESRSRRLAITDVVAKVQGVLEEVALRGKAMPSEQMRVKNAFDILANPSRLSKAKGEEDYLHILQQIRKKCGPQMVAVVAAGLGKSAIMQIPKRDRLRLAKFLSDHRNELESTVLQNLAGKYGEIFCICARNLANVILASSSNLSIEQVVPPEPTLDGNVTIEQVVPSEQTFSEYLDPDSREPHSRVYQLDLEDAKLVISSEHVRGRVFLIEPHGRQSLPFMTVNLTEELCGHFTRMRNPV